MTTTKQPVGRPIASRDGAATSWVQLRVTRRRKAAWVKASAPGKLSAWVQEQLDRAANYQDSW
jgi:hypothetical protein